MKSPFAAFRWPLLGTSWRYTVVGLACALSNYAIMLAVDFFGGHYLVGTVIAFTIVTPFAYVMHSRFTFAQPLSSKALIRFTAGVASAYPVAAGLMIVLCSGLRLGVAIATPIATIIMFSWNFAAAHWSILPRIGLLDLKLQTSSSRDKKAVLRGADTGVS